MEEAAANWRYDERYGDKFHDGTWKNWSGTRSAAFPYGHRDDGTIFVMPEDVNPDDDFLGHTSGPDSPM
jgi:hypothetical protein